MVRSTAALVGVVLLGACASTPKPPANAPSIDLGTRPPGVIVTARYVTYPVTAATLREIRTELARAGPAIDGRRWEGRTRANVAWRWQYRRPASNLCRMRDPRVEVVAEITMPEWKPGVEADDDTKVWWQRYHAALLQHELGHGRLAVEWAGRIARTLGRPREGASCEEVGALANRDAQRLMSELRERQAAYDRETRHGADQIRAATTAPAP